VANKNMNKIIKLFILTAIASTALVFGVAGTASAAQNPNYPTPSQCNDATWNIGIPDGVTCTGTSSINSDNFKSYTTCSIQQKEHLLKPDIATLNKYCQLSYGANSFAKTTLIHSCCSGTCGNVSWVNNAWNCGWVPAGGDSVSLYIECATGCNSINTCTSHSKQFCSGDGVYWFDSCGNRQELVASCGSNQICQNAQCIQACPTGYTNVAQGKTATENASNPGTARRSPSQAIDGISSTWWATGSASSASMSVDLQSEFDVSKFIIQCGGLGTGNSGTVHFFNAVGQEVASKNYVCLGGNITEKGVYSISSDSFSDIKVKSVRVDANTNGSVGDWINVNELKVCGKAQTIACYTNADCGISAYTGSPFCQSGNVYQNYITYTCNNAGTASSSCSHNTVAQKKNDCTANQVCQNGGCINQTIACSTNAQCGTNGFVSGPFCKNGDVYKTYKTFTCSNPGTASSSCSNSLNDQLITNCTANQTCANGTCVNQNIICSTNSQCGTNGFVGSPFCQGNSIWQNYITYTCLNPGTASSSCSHSTVAQRKTICDAAGQVCSNGNCVNSQSDLAVTCHTTPNPTQINQQVSFIANATGGNGSYTYSWTGSCTGSSSSTCQGSFYQTGAQTATVEVTSGTKTVNATCSVDVNQTCKPNNSQKCVGNAVYWFDSCNVQGGLVKTCYENQTCSNGQCITQTIACSSNSDCGTNAFVDYPYCGGNNSVLQNYITYTCLNPGTASSSCSHSTEAKNKNTCTANQTCSGGSCITNQPIACSVNADCGVSTISGSPYCGTNNSVYQNYTNPTCLNPGTTSSSCANPVTSQLVNTCTTNQVCSNGSCSNQTIACSVNSDCGTNALTGSPFCQGSSIYQNFKTYTCNNAGTVTSSCSNSTEVQLQNTCTTNQTCQNGSCVTNQNNLTVSCFASPNPANANQSVTFTSNVSGGTGNYIYLWSGACTGSSSTCAKTFSSSGTQTATLNISSDGQSNNSTCSVNINQNCSYHSYQQCVGNYLYWYDSCGTQQDSQYCSNGCSGNSCQNNNNNVTVQTNSATNAYNNQATLNGYLYTDNGNSGSCNTYVWFQYGTSTYYGSETVHLSQNYSGTFTQNIITNVNSGNVYHFRAVAQGCSGNIIYGQDMTVFNNNNTGGTLTLSKTVKNLTNGASFSTSTYASPSDTLLFLITVQATGNQDIQNVVVRDYLPANLIYNNQLTVACSTNNSSYTNYNNCGTGNYNYTGNISSGVFLNTVYAGQTVTISYQAQVAAAGNFSYGSTTLNNNVSVTSSTGTNPTASASVVVTRSAVYGASSISTGLTNNFWVDSFLLPLLVVLIGLWMWKSGMFFMVEKWLDNQKKKSRGYKANKELSARITAIQKVERI
jgi:hypothetical protein